MKDHTLRTPSIETWNNVNTKQNYGVIKLYFKMVLERLKMMGGIIFFIPMWHGTHSKKFPQMPF